MIYEFRDRETGVVEERIMKLSELDQFIIDNPHLEKIITSSGGVVYEAGTNLKVSDAFKEVISRGEEKLGKKYVKSGKW